MADEIARLMHASEEDREIKNVLINDLFGKRMKMHLITTQQ